MKKALLGAGGFAREILVHMNMDMPCFVDDEYYTPNTNNIYPLSDFDSSEYEVLIAIGDPIARKTIVEKLPKDTQYFSFIHPSATLLGTDIEIGDGSIVCAGCILTTNIKVGSHTHLNLQTTIGHDCVIGDYFTTAPGVKISGNCNIGDCVYVGTNASIKEKINIQSNTTIGLNAGIVKHINEPGVYVGTPAKKL